MRINQDPELREAVLFLPQKEKDQLLLKLISKDPVLFNQLRFKLLEDENDLAERQEAVREKIKSHFNRLESLFKQTRHRTARNLLIGLKTASGFVNEHVLITKDKLGEIDLRLFILNQSFIHYGQQFMSTTTGTNEKLLLYQASRIKTVWEKYGRIHEDLQFEVKEQLNNVLHFADHSAVKAHLTNTNIPQEV